MMYITNCICNGFVRIYKGDYICIYSLQSMWSYFLSIKAIKTFFNKYELVFNKYELTSQLIFHNIFEIILFELIKWNNFCIIKKLYKLDIIIWYLIKLFTIPLY